MLTFVNVEIVMWLHKRNFLFSGINAEIFSRDISICLHLTFKWLIRELTGKKKKKRNKKGRKGRTGRKEGEE